MDKPTYNNFLNFGFKKTLLFVWVSFSCFSLFGQGAGLQFNSGFGKPIVNFDAPGSTVNYQSAMYNDTRIGIWVGDYDKLSGGIVFGAFNVDANYVNPDGLASEFQYSSLLIDVPIRYAFENKFIKSVSFGPSLNLTMSSKQNINGRPVFNQEILKSNNWSMGLEINLKGLELDKFNISPYFNYRHMLNSADALNEDETLKIHSFSIGIRCDIFLTL